MYGATSVTVKGDKSDMDGRSESSCKDRLYCYCFGFFVLVLTCAPVISLILLLVYDSDNGAGIFTSAMFIAVDFGVWLLILVCCCANHDLS